VAFEDVSTLLLVLDAEDRATEKIDREKRAIAELAAVVDAAAANIDAATASMDASLAANAAETEVAKEAERGLSENMQGLSRSDIPDLDAMLSQMGYDAEQASQHITGIGDAAHASADDMRTIQIAAEDTTRVLGEGKTAAHGLTTEVIDTGHAASGTAGDLSNLDEAVRSNGTAAAEVIDQWSSVRSTLGGMDSDLRKAADDAKLMRESFQQLARSMGVTDADFRKALSSLKAAGAEIPKTGEDARALAVEMNSVDEALGRVALDAMKVTDVDWERLSAAAQDVQRLRIAHQQLASSLGITEAEARKLLKSFSDAEQAEEKVRRGAEDAKEGIDKVGNAAKDTESLLSRLSRGAEDTGKAIAGLGSSADGASGHMSRMQLIIAGVAAAIAGLSGPIAGLLSLGIPALFGGIGLAAIGMANSIQKAQAAGQQLTLTQQLMLPIVEPLAKAFNQLQPELIGAARGFGAVMQSLSPQFQAIVRDMGPMITTLGAAFGDFVRILTNGFLPIMKDVQDVVAAFGVGLRSLAQGFVDFFARIDFRQAAAGVVFFFDDLRQLMGVLGDLLTAFMPIGNAILHDILPPVLRLLDALINGLRPALLATGNALTTLGRPLSDLASALGPLIPPLGELARLLLPGVVRMLGAFIEGATALARALTPVVQQIDDFLKRHPQLASMLGEIIGLFIVWRVIGLLGIPAAIGGIVKAVGTLLDTLESLGKAAEKVVKALKWIGTTLVEDVLPFLLDNPWVLLVAALVAAGVLIYTHWGQIKDFLIKTWRDIEDAAKQSWSALEKWWHDRVENMKKTGDDFKKWWDSLPDSIGKAVQAAVKWFQDLPAKIGSAIGQGMGSMNKQGQDFVHSFLDGMARGEVQLVDFWKQLPHKISTFMQGARTWLNNTGYNALVGLRDGAENGWRAYQQWQNSIPGSIKQLFAPARTWLNNAGYNALVGLRDGAENAWRAVTDWLGKLPQQIVDMLRRTVDLTPKIGSDVMEGFKNGLIGWFQPISDELQKGIQGWISGFKKGLGVGSPSTIFMQIGADVLQGFLQGLQNMIGSVTGFISGIPGHITGFFAGAGSWLYNAGYNLMVGLYNGIQSMAGEIYSAVSNIVGWIRDHLPFSPAKIGPLSGSGAPIYAGISIGRQLADGMLSQVGAIRRASAALTTAAGVGGTTGVAANLTGSLGLNAAALAGAGSARPNVQITFTGNHIMSDRDMDQFVTKMGPSLVRNLQQAGVFPRR